jgi:hypothetical protein
MDVGIALPKVALVAIALVAILFLLLLGRIAGEAHYGNCLEQVALEYPATAQQDPGLVNERQAAIDDCSRWP